MSDWSDQVSWMRALLQSTVLLATLCGSAGLAHAQKPTYNFYGLGSYIVLMQVHTANPTGHLNELTARRAAAADFSIDLNRTTAAFGSAQPIGPCNVAGAKEKATIGNGPGTFAAVAHHAYVAPSYAFLPDSYRKDFVRSTFVGLTSAANKMLADPAVSTQMKSFILGEYLHFAQDMFLNQSDAEAGGPVEISPDMGPGARSLINKDGQITDAALGAFAFTYDAARAFNLTGAVPGAPTAEKFESLFYARLSPGDRIQTVKTLQQAGIYPYVELIARSEGASRADRDKLRSETAQLWIIAHPNDTSFQPPQIDAPAFRDFVNYDVHPKWLVPDLLRRDEAMKARRPIDELALARQAGDLLRAKIGQIEGSRKDASGRVSVEALKKYSSDGEAALTKTTTAKDAKERRMSLASALSIFRQALRYAEQIEIGAQGASQETARSSSNPAPCIDEQLRATEAFEQQLNQVVALAVAVALDRMDPALAPDDEEACRVAAFDDVRSVLKGGAPVVPEKCRAVARGGRLALREYARTHIRRLNSGLEELLSNIR